jgi:hypothetical protein
MTAPNVINQGEQTSLKNLVRDAHRLGIPVSKSVDQECELHDRLTRHDPLNTQRELQQAHAELASAPAGKISAVLAAIGVMENENSEVRPLLDRFDAVAREAGCRGVVVVHHTGHDKSRARGASSFGDWPTAMWTLERDGDKPSQFRARGRDVYVERSGLVYDQNTRQLSKLVGPDDADAEYFRLRRGEQLTTAQVADELAISKHTAKRRLEDAGWEITQEAQGTIPAVWEYPNTADDRWAPDPFA